MKYQEKIKIQIKQQSTQTSRKTIEISKKRSWDIAEETQKKSPKKRMKQTSNTECNAEALPI